MLHTNMDACWVLDAAHTEQALSSGLTHLLAAGERSSSRGGDVIVAPCPVVTVTREPRRRWLLSAWRDANPFFHLVEAAWMLAGRRDSAALVPYVKRFTEFAERGGDVHGAYGHRWRTHYGYDQLQVVIDKLRASPSDRQAVVAMWCATDVLGDDLRGTWKDRPCNTHLYLRVRQRWASGWRDSEGEGAGLTKPVLDMTVCCRSNDAVWGAHGANAVHFSYLLEYLSLAVGVDVGHLTQVSNNYHAYLATVNPMMERQDFGYPDPRADGLDLGPPMAVQAGHVDADLPRLWAVLDSTLHRGVYVHGEDYINTGLHTNFARDVLAAARAHCLFRSGQWERADKIVDVEMATPGWAMACGEWLQRRWKASDVTARVSG